MSHSNTNFVIEGGGEFDVGYAFNGRKLPIPEEAQDELMRYKTVQWIDLRFSKNQRQWTIIKHGPQPSRFKFFVGRDGGKVHVWTQAGQNNHEAATLLAVAEKGIAEAEKRQLNGSFLFRFETPHVCFLKKEADQFQLFSLEPYGLRVNELADVREIYENLAEMFQTISTLRLGQLG